MRYKRCHNNECQWELEKKAKQQQPRQSVGQEAKGQGQRHQAEGAAQSRITDGGRQDREGMDWSKVEQAAEAAASPGGKSKTAYRHPLNRIQAWGVQAHGRQWEQPVGVNWHNVIIGKGAAGTVMGVWWGRSRGQSIHDARTAAARWRQGAL